MATLPKPRLCTALVAVAVLTCALLTLCAGPLGAQRRPAAASSRAVRSWQDSLWIPTYVVGPADPHPIFYEGQEYQGAQRRVYPYALQDALTGRRETRRYAALHLENEYVQITVLPELGGRLFAAVDRTNGYDFFYRQHVIKPALIGMLGAWISGGIEWCVFHHHRSTTFMPVDHALTSGADGSRTIWVGELERRQRMRWLVGMTLRPGSSVLEVTVRLLNRTAMPETMLYWANAAVHANDRYQVVFPPSVRVATFHAKNVFTRWPVGSGVYAGGVDYTGVDLSWWRNHPSPTSFFAWDLGEDFSGGYDHGRDAGVVHVGDHHVLAGAKLWEWGPGEAGTLWDSRILTDDDGPYAELMVGAYSDNQPDYSWFAPYAVRTFTHHWFPVRGIGGFTNATVDAAVNLQVAEDVATVGFHATGAQRGARALLTAAGRRVLDTTIAIDPGHPFVGRVPLPPGTAPSDVEAELRRSDGSTLVRDRPRAPSPPPVLPGPVRAPPPPEDVATADELYAIGQRAEQINSPRVDPDAYFAEMLRRDTGDARSNLRVGQHLNRRWRFAEAEAHLRRALARLGPGYTRPGDGEAEYQLGLALRGQGRFAEARDAFQRAAWDRPHEPAAFHQLAELSLREGRWARALAEIRRALAAGAGADRARAYEAAALRRLGRAAEAERVALAAAADDPFAFLARNEVALARRARTAAGERAALADLAARMRDEPESYLDLATDYEVAGLWEEAAEVLRRAIGLPGPSGRPHPLVHYHLAADLERLGHTVDAAGSAAAGAALPIDYVFPFRLESLDALGVAVRRDPRDARALIYLGNLLYERQPDEAIHTWEAARDLAPGLALVHRNLGWAYRHRQQDPTRAIASYERARAADPHDARIAVELDVLYELANAPLETRLASLSRSRASVRARSDGMAREAAVLVGLGRFAEALELFERNRFHPEELSGAVHEHFADAHLLRGLQRLTARDATGALADFAAAGTYPDNLEVGRPRNDPRAPQVAVLTGFAREVAGDSAEARRLFERAAAQQGTDGWPETRFWQGLALARLGRGADADAALDAVRRAGEAAVTRAIEPGAAARPGWEGREAAARRLLGMALLGRDLVGAGDAGAARRELERAAVLRVADPWPRYFLSTLGSGR